MTEPIPCSCSCSCGCDHAEAKIPWARLAVAGFFALAAEGAHFLEEGGILPHGPAEYLSLIFALLAILCAGLHTYRQGWLALKNRNLNINALISVAVTGAVIIGQFAEAAMVMVLFNLAEALEAMSLDRARKAIKKLLDLAPETASVLQDSTGRAQPFDLEQTVLVQSDLIGPDNDEEIWVEMDARLVEVGNRVRIRPGERIPLDGIIVQGRSSINQAPITGESLPVDKDVGDPVYAGTINGPGFFIFTVTAKSTDSTLARIIQVVEKAQASRAPVQRIVDRFAAVYTPAIFLAALLTAVIPPLFMGGLWSEWVYTGLVILVIGCPCALVISTPVCIVSGMAAAARQGVLVKGGIHLEQSRLLSWLALDKTGTVTHGKPVLTDCIPAGNMDEATTTALAASLAAHSDHPVSKAITGYAAAGGAPLLAVDDFTALPGLGLRGVVNGAGGGTLWHLGNHRLATELGSTAATPVAATSLNENIRNLEKQGKSVTLLIGENGVEGLFAVADTLKEDSILAIRSLQQLGIKTMMLTGDNEYTARAIAEKAGIDACRADLLPEDKLAAIEQLAKEAGNGVIGMVGDGINDAPALAGASVGFALGGAGSGAAIETADVVLMDDDLRKIPRFVRLSRATYAILMQNIVLALGIKALFFILAFTGHATMWMAVFADMGACLLVVANGLRAMRK